MDYARSEMTAGISHTPPQLLCKPFSSMTNTLCISDPSGTWSVVEAQIVRELSEFGEIARLDTSLAGSLGTVLVTYFDVRCAQYVLMHMAPRAEPFTPAAHDCRAVSVDVAAFCEKTGNLGVFQEYGEVANVSIFGGEALVEFYDMRAAQALLASAGGSASPLSLGGGATMPRAGSAPLTVPAREAGSEGAAQLPEPPGIGRRTVATAERGGASGAASPSASPNTGRKVSRASTVSTQLPQDGGSVPESPLQQGDKNSHRPVRTKIDNKDFRKFDIDPDAILRGADKRTTVMVRHLQGVCARKEFLLFLDKCGLGDRYSFFYMPCKEHRNVPAGFAFVNFASAHDVHTLFGAVQSGLWREVCSGSPNRSPAVSYARFQGHDDLVEHFSLSAVLHEQDPEKRPIFRPEVAKLASSVHDPVGPAKADREAQQQARASEPPPRGADKPPLEAAKQEKGGADSPASSLLAVSSMQLQAAVEALLRKQAEAKRRAEAGDLGQSGSPEEADGGDDAAAGSRITAAAAEEAEAGVASESPPAAKTAEAAIGQEEDYSTRMFGA